MHGRRGREEGGGQAAVAWRLAEEEISAATRWHAHCVHARRSPRTAHAAHAPRAQLAAAHHLSSPRTYGVAARLPIHINHHASITARRSPTNHTRMPLKARAVPGRRDNR